MKTQQHQKKSAKQTADKSWFAPKRDLACRFAHTFRFTSSGATDQPVVGADLLGLLAVATSGTGCSSAIAAVKLKRITLRVPNTSIGGTGYCAVNWVGQTYQAPTLLSAIAMGTAEPAIVVSKPPKMSAASFWITYGSRTATIVSLTAPSGTVIDVDATVVLQNASKLANGGVLTYVSSGLTAGYIYFGQLDKDSGTPKFIPIEVAYYG